MNLVLFEFALSYTALILTDVGILIYTNSTNPHIKNIPEIILGLTPVAIASVFYYIDNVALNVALNVANQIRPLIKDMFNALEYFQMIMGLRSSPSHGLAFDRRPLR